MENTRLIWHLAAGKHSFHGNNEPQKQGKCEREGKDVEIASSGRCRGECGLEGKQGSKVTHRLSVPLSQQRRTQTGLVHADAQLILSSLSLMPTVQRVWVIKVKSGHERRSGFRPTFQVHHPPVIWSTYTAGEQWGKKGLPLPSNKSAPSNTFSYSCIKWVNVQGLKV